MTRDKDESPHRNPQEKEAPKRALLVTTPLGPEQKALAQDHIDELELLVRTYGLTTVKKVICTLRQIKASTLVTKGKLDELLEELHESNAQVVVFDDEVSPAQQRNLEKALGVPVMDRTEVILEVFAERAQTHEAHLQIELARIRYQQPRLKRLWTHLSRQAAGGGSGAYLKGEGEKQIEIDRRILKRKVDKLKRELKEVQSHRDTLHASRRRSHLPMFGLVGYTNAGKSTLMNSLTEAGVFVEDKLFATLDTTIRKFTMKNNQDILLIDTVGFIRKLPHQLVAAFRSTLEEVCEADILLHVVDSSNHAAVEQAAATLQVLTELGAADKPMITVLNKMDRADTQSMATRLRIEYPKTVQISAKEGTGFDELQERMIEAASQFRRRVSLRIPQKNYDVVSRVMEEGEVIEKQYEGNDVLLDVELPSSLVGALDKYITDEN